MLTVLPTDVSFTSSPDAGNPECVCSRCLQKIKAEEAPVLRFYTTNDEGKIDIDSREYRFCNQCQSNRKSVADFTPETMKMFGELLESMLPDHIGFWKAGKKSKELITL